jgi:hypothetical protein
MLLRIDDTDPATVPTLESCSRMVSALADAEMMAMVEPLPYLKRAKGHAVLDPSVPHLIRAVAVASGLGWTSAWTWLKVPSGPQVSQVLAASTLPALILGGAPGPDPGAELVSWSQAMMEPTCRGLVVGRSLLYPQGGDVAARIAEAADLFPSRRGAPR